ncbi:MAG: hypothetical protein WCJ29_05215 [bacterium]
MNTTSKLAILSLSLVLFGAGCSLGAKKVAPPTGGMFFSPDRGTSWQQITVQYTSDGILNWSTSDVLMTVVDPSDSNAIYAGTRENGLKYTYDSGKTWMSPKDVSAGAAQAVAVNPKDKCTIYVAKLPELWKSEDCNRTYKRIFTPEIGQDYFKAILIDQSSPSTIYAITQGGSLFKSASGGVSWQSNHRFEDAVNSFVMDPFDSRIMLVGTAGSGIYRTVDAGVTWESLREKTKDLVGGNQVKSIVSAKSTKGLYIAAIANGLIRSKDGGNTWEVVKTLVNPPQMNIISLAVDPKNAEAIYYGTEAVFYRTANGGTTWETIKLPTARAAGTLLVHPDSNGAIYLGAKNLVVK